MSIQEFVARAAGCGAEANHLDAGPLWDRGRFQMVIHDDWMIWGTPLTWQTPIRGIENTLLAWWTKATKELYAALLGSMTTHKNGKPINEMGQQMKFWFIQLHGEIMEKCWGGILVQSYIYIYEPIPGEKSVCFRFQSEGLGWFVATWALIWMLPERCTGFSPPLDHFWKGKPIDFHSCS